jgi:L-rhamnose isomerase
MLCLDMGHYHPTESVADKIGALLLYLDEILLHVSRGVRWDSDHVVILNDELIDLAKELVRGGFLARTNIGLDFFDASINRVAAWVIGVRSTQKALMIALLEPRAIQEAELKGDLTGRLALMEDCKLLPAGAVWDYFCETQKVPPADRWLEDARAYERSMLGSRR